MARERARPRKSHVRRPEDRRRRPVPLGAVLVFGLVAFGLLTVLRPSGEGAGREPLGPSGGVVTATRKPVPPPPPGHEVYGYVPYWEMDDGIAGHLAATDLTTLALFSVTHRPDGELDTGTAGFGRLEGGVGRRLLNEAHERGTRVELVYTAFGEERNRPFFSDRAAQDRWIAVLAEFATERGFDGVNVDVEGLPLDLVPAYGGFVGRLREALRARNADAQVSVATGASHLGAAMAAVAASAGADRIFLMGYDYRTAGTEPGATAPLDRTDGGEKDLTWSLDLYASLGVPPERTILGLPLYGVTWPVLGPDFGAMATGRGDSWVPRRHLGLFENPEFEATFDETESVEFHVAGRKGAWTAIYYDSPRSLAPKLALADERGLAGAGFWAIGYERGLPAYTQLITAFRAGRLAAVGGSR